MNNLIKIVVFGLGATIVGFLIFGAIFWFLLSNRGAESAEAATAGEPPAPTAHPAARQESGQTPGGDVLAYADVLGGDIPAEPQVSGYDWASWGMTGEQVRQHLDQEGQREIISYSPPGTELTILTVLNPDDRRFKVEYRFHAGGLFYVEVYYSDFYRNQSFNQFLLNMMQEYGRPYEESATVDELGKVVLHAKWDTEASLIELVSRPNGRFSLHLSSQLTMIQLEEARKTEERLSAY